jgi:hypothetical protein
MISGKYIKTEIEKCNSGKGRRLVLIMLINGRLLKSWFQAIPFQKQTELRRHGIYVRPHFQGAVNRISQGSRS